MKIWLERWPRPKVFLLTVCHDEIWFLSFRFRCQNGLASLGYVKVKWMQSDGFSWLFVGQSLLPVELFEVTIWWLSNNFSVYILDVAYSDVSITIYITLIINQHRFFGLKSDQKRIEFSICLIRYYKPCTPEMLRQTCVPLLPEVSEIGIRYWN